MTSDNPYERMLPTGPFDKAVDAAIEEENAAFEVEYAADPERLRREIGESVTRWEHVHAAQEAAGAHAVVIPIATAKAILAALQGQPNVLDDTFPGLTTRALTDALKKAEERP